MTDRQPRSRLPDLLRRGSRHGMAALGLVAALLAGCGGTSQVETFVPRHMHVFGDELVAMDSSGHRYGINSVATTTATDAGGNTTTTETFSCGGLPLFTQSLASVYGLVFEECPGTATTFTAFNHAAFGADVAALEAQLAAQSAKLAAGDLAIVHVGLNDVVALYQQVSAGGSLAAAQAEAVARGNRVAAQVQALIRRGVKVAIVTPPALEYSPWAQGLGSAATGIIAAIGTELIDGIITPVGQNQARDVIMAVGSDVVLSYVRSAESGSSIIITDTACTQTAQALLGCQSNALKTTTSSVNLNLWADDKRPTWLYHNTVASTLLNLVRFF